MKCPIESRETSETLLAYSARRLDPDARAVLERHMEICPACREFARGQQAVWQALEDWEAAPVTIDFNRRLYRRIDGEERSPWWRAAANWQGQALWRRGLPAVAAACLLVIAGAIFDSPRTPRMEGERADAVQADQVERTLEDMELLQSFTQEVRGQLPNRM
jgi:anti-sigma factor RsiW